MKLRADVYTLDLFASHPVVAAEPFVLSDVMARLGAHLAIDRLMWWSHPDRELLRGDSQWSTVFLHLRAAAPRTQTLAEDAGRSAAGGLSQRAAAPLGIYGENAVTFDEKTAQ